MEKTFKLKLTNVNQTPRKTGLVASLIRQRSVEDALVILEYTPKRAAASFIKLLNNVKGTARHNYKMDLNTLMIEEIFTTAGKTGKIAVRQRRVPKKTRQYRVIILRRTSHIFITVKGQVKASAAPKKVENSTKEKEKNGSESKSN